MTDAENERKEIALLKGQLEAAIAAGDKQKIAGIRYALAMAEIALDIALSQEQ